VARARRLQLRGQLRHGNPWSDPDICLSNVGTSQPTKAFRTAFPVRSL